MKVLLDPDADFVANESDLSRSESNSSTWGEEDSLEPYSLEDDEEDIRRVPRPHSLQDCFAYLVAPDSDNLAYDKKKQVDGNVSLQGVVTEQDPDKANCTRRQ